MGVKLYDLDTIFKECDAISIHVPYTKENHHIVNAQRIAMMKEDAVIVCTARGGLVDEEALAAALKEGKILGAGLDVFAQEPLGTDSPLIGLDNVILTPMSLPRPPTRCGACTRRPSTSPRTSSAARTSVGTCSTRITRADSRQLWQETGCFVAFSPQIRQRPRGSTKGTERLSIWNERKTPHRISGAQARRRVCLRGPSSSPYTARRRSRLGLRAEHSARRQNWSRYALFYRTGQRRNRYQGGPV